MATYDANTAAGQIFPIVGAGIGLGLLAGTSRAVMDTMYGDRWRPPRRARRTYRKPKTFQPQYRRRAYYQPPYKPRYRYRW